MWHTQYIHWRGSSSGTLWNVGSHFTPITPRSTLTCHAKTHQAPIYASNKFVWDNIFKFFWTTLIFLTRKILIFQLSDKVFICLKWLKRYKDLCNVCIYPTPPSGRMRHVVILKWGTASLHSELVYISTNFHFKECCKKVLNQSAACCIGILIHIYIYIYIYVCVCVCVCAYACARRVFLILVLKKI